MLPRRILISAILAVLLLGVSSAYAGFRWMDPIWDVNGTQVFVDVGYHSKAESEVVALVAGTRVTLYVPAGVPVTLLDPQGAQVAVQELHGVEPAAGDIPIKVEVSVPNTVSPYRFRVIVEAGSQKWNQAGWSTQNLTLEGSLAR